MEQTKRGSTLELSGSLDVRCIGEVRTAVYRLLDECDGVVYVNIAQVESVDMTTLKMLAVANRAAERAGQQVVLTGGSPGLRRLLHLSHLRSMLPVEPGWQPSNA